MVFLMLIRFSHDYNAFAVLKHTSIQLGLQSFNLND
jgi:hypothetical protein